MAKKSRSGAGRNAIDVPAEGDVSPADIRAKLAQIDSSFQQTTKAAAPIGLAVGAGAVLVMIVVVFAIGKRRGAKRSTVVEIRRI